MKKYYILSKTATVESYQGIFNNFGLIDTEIVSYVRAVNHVFVDNIISDKDSLILLIPTILDPFNAYSYDGVEYALKYYCHFVSIKKGDFQIILLGTEEESSFWKHCEYSSFLKCPHVSYLKNNVYPLKEYLAHIEAIVFDMDWTCCIDRLKQVNVKKPASYKTHHSITNEWSIYRWSKYLSIENIAIQKDIEEFLYFNYLKAIYPESKIDNPKSFLIAEKGKVLLIDDEVGKGWHTFFKSFLSFSHNVTFDSIGSNYKNLSKEDIIAQTEAKIKEFDPDVVLLDLRLHDTDFEDKSPSELTGAKVFEKIKNYNKGIQIVIFSASNKVWNYLPFASDGVILKESPENSVKRNYSKEAMTNLKDSLANALQKGHFLNPLYKDIVRIQQNLPKNDFGNSVCKQFDLAFYLISKAERKEQYAFAYVSLYMIIELINKEKLTQSGNADWTLKSNSNERVKAWSYDAESKTIISFSYKKDKDGNKVFTPEGNEIIVSIANGNEATEWLKITGVLKQEYNTAIPDKDLVDLSRRIQARNWFVHNDPRLEQKQVKNGKTVLIHPIHYEIYSKEGFLNLFKLVKTICSYL